MNTKKPHTTPLQARSLDIPQFAATNAATHGTTQLMELPRLAQAAPQAQTDIHIQWQAHGRTQAVPESATEIWLNIQAQVQLPFICQRCLQDMEQTIAIQRAIRFVHDEVTAAALDEDLEEDVLVHSTQFDLLELIEDELIMALPYAPKHAHCAGTAQSHTSDDTAHPFAALQQLKKQ